MDYTNILIKKNIILQFFFCKSWLLHPIGAMVLCQHLYPFGRAYLLRCTKVLADNPSVIITRSDHFMWQ